MASLGKMAQMITPYQRRFASYIYMIWVYTRNTYVDIELSYIHVCVHIYVYIYIYAFASDQYLFDVDASLSYLGYWLTRVKIVWSTINPPSFAITFTYDGAFTPLIASFMEPTRGPPHYDDVTMGAKASQITSLTIVYSTFYSGADQSKHQSSASLAFVWGIHRGPVNSPHKWPVTRKMFLFDDVIMLGPTGRYLYRPKMFLGQLWLLMSRLYCDVYFNWSLCQLSLAY